MLAGSADKNAAVVLHCMPAQPCRCPYIGATVAWSVAEAGCNVTCPAPVYYAAGPPGSAMPPRPWEQPAGSLRVHHRHLPGLLAAAGGSEGLFWHLFGGSSSSRGGGGGNCTAEGCCSSRLGSSSDPQADTFWLDSATPDRGRFSFMGGRGGSLWRRVEYRLPPNALAAAAAGIAEAGSSLGGPQQAATNGAAAHLGSGGGSHKPPQGTLVLTAADSSEQRITADFFGWLQALLASHRCRVRCAFPGWPVGVSAAERASWGGALGVFAVHPCSTSRSSQQALLSFVCPQLCHNLPPHPHCFSLQSRGCSRPAL